MVACPDNLPLTRRQPGSIGWYYSIPDLEDLGVRNVSINGDDWRPAAPFDDVKFCCVALGPGRDE